MGNRANVVFVAGEEISPAVYLHWQGGPESVYAFLDELDRRHCRPDANYECARFIAIVAEFFDHDDYGTLSLGVTNGPAEITTAALARVHTDNSDNGFYVVNRGDRSGVTAYADLGLALDRGEVKPPAPRRSVRRFIWHWDRNQMTEMDASWVEAERRSALAEPGMPGYEALRRFFESNPKKVSEFA